MNEPTPAHHAPATLRRLQATGVLLFLFIPLVLFLFVRRPEPIALSLAAGVALMVGHRLLARPYMHRVRRRKCLWSNRGVDDRGDNDSGDVAARIATLTLGTRAGEVEACCRREHLTAVGSFFTTLDHWRWPLRVGILVPLLVLLGTAMAVAMGYDAPITQVTAGFQLVIGLTVNAVALGYRFASPIARPTVPFPVHNFFLLGVRNLLWVLRLVGVWWIVVGLRTLV